MKRKVRTTLVGLVVLGFGGMAIYTYQLLKVEPEVYVAPQIVTETVEVQVNPRDAKIEEREVELSAKYESIKKLEAKLDVLLEEEEELQGEIKETQAELASFMTGIQ